MPRKKNPNSQVRRSEAPYEVGYGKPPKHTQLSPANLVTRKAGHVVQPKLQNHVQ